MAIRFDQYNDVAVLSPEGDLRGAEAATALREAAGTAPDGGPVASLVIDFERVRFVDGAGLEALLWSRGRLGNDMAALRLAALDANCRKILEMTRLDDRFDVHPDVP